MHYRKLGKSGLMVSEIGFGCWPIGGGWGNQDDARDIVTLKSAYDQGINFYDTAMGYGNGHSEEVLGEAFHYMRDKVIIASKIGPKVQPSEPADKAYPADWIITCTENSLRRLKTDYLDVQQIHCWRDHFTDVDGWYNAFTKLKQEGKVRYFGVSAEDWEWNGSVRIVESGKIESVQAIYNIFDQQPEKKLFPATIKNNVGVIVRVSLLEGLLAGKIRTGHRFTDDDWRKDFFTEKRLTEAEPHLKKLENLIGGDYPTLAQLGLKFCLSHKAVSTVIVGMTNSKHLVENCALSNGKSLSAEMLKALGKHAFEHGWVYPWHEKK